MERNVGTPIPVGNFAGSVSIVPYQPKPNGGYKCTTCSPITAEARMLFFNNAMMLNISRAASGGCTLNRQSYYFFNVCHSERKRGCIRTCMRTHPLAGVFFPASASGFCSLLFNDDVPFSFCPPPSQNKIILVFPFPVPSRHHHRPPPLFFHLFCSLHPTLVAHTLTTMWARCPWRALSFPCVCTLTTASATSASSWMARALAPPLPIVLPAKQVSVWASGWRKGRAQSRGYEEWGMEGNLGREGKCDVGISSHCSPCLRNLVCN